MDLTQQLRDIRRTAGISGTQDVLYPDIETGAVTTPIKPSISRPAFDYSTTLPDLPALEVPTMGKVPQLKLPAAPGTEGGIALPEIEMPEIKIAQFKAPEWSEQAITTLAQKKAAPGTRALKEGLRETLATTSANDPISRHNAREALAGYSKGLGDIMAEGHSAAIQEYSTRYGYEFQGAAIQFEAEADAIAREYQGKLAVNMAQYEGKLQAVMAEYQTQVAGASLEYQSAFNMMMRQYEVEAQASMLKYETETSRQNLQAELDFKAATLDYESLMQDYMAQWGQQTVTPQDRERAETESWTPPAGSPGWANWRVFGRNR